MNEPISPIMLVSDSDDAERLTADGCGVGAALAVSSQLDEAILYLQY